MSSLSRLLSSTRCLKRQPHKYPIRNLFTNVTEGPGEVEAEGEDIDWDPAKLFGIDHEPSPILKMQANRAHFKSLGKSIF